MLASRVYHLKQIQWLHKMLCLLASALCILQYCSAMERKFLQQFWWGGKKHQSEALASEVKIIEKMLRLNKLRKHCSYFGKQYHTSGDELILPLPSEFCYILGASLGTWVLIKAVIYDWDLKHLNATCMFGEIQEDRVQAPWCRPQASHWTRAMETSSHL